MQFFVVISTLMVLALGFASGTELNADLIWDSKDSIWRLEEDYNTLAQVLGPRMDELNEPDTIEGAMKALASLRQKWPLKANGLLGMIGVSGEQPIEVMDLFEKLGEAYNKCDYGSFKILKWNYFLAVGRVPARLDGSKSKLHSVVRQAWEQYSSTCHSEHLKQFKSLTNSDRFIIEMMRNVIDKDSISEIFGTNDLKTILEMKPNEVSERLPKTGKFWMKRTYDVSRGTVGATHLEMDHNEIHLTYEGRKIKDWPRQAIQSRISNKCEFIFRGPDILRPVMFDLVFDDSKLDEITQGDEEFEHTLAMLKACQAIVDNRELLISEVRKYLGPSLF